MNPYEVLGVSRRASQVEIEAAYNRLFDEHEPAAQAGDDSAIEELERLNEAHDTLADADQRRALDARLRRTARERSVPSKSVKVAPRMTADGTARRAAQPARAYQR